MRKNHIFSLLAISLLTMAVLSCEKDDDIESPMVPEPTDTTTTSKVVFNMDSIPYEKLSDYGFFSGNLVELNPVTDVLPYTVITPLFSDYAKKKRFVWMPDSVKAQYSGDHEVLDFPDGSVLIKVFYYDNVQPSNDSRVIETRLMFKRDGGWEFAEYVWNNDQTEAYLDMNGGFTDVSFMNEDQELQSLNYRIPSQAECNTCHKLDGQPIPIGPKPQNINSNYDYTDGVKNQLIKWEEMGYLEPDYPLNIVTTVDFSDESQTLPKRLRSYLDMNCAHCHREGSHCDYRPIRLAFSESTVAENLGICVEPNENIDEALTHIIAPERPARSEMLFRMESNLENERMPLLGRTVVHQKGVDLLIEYINSLEGPC